MSEFEQGDLFSLADETRKEGFGAAVRKEAEQLPEDVIGERREAVADLLRGVIYPVTGNDTETLYGAWGRPPFDRVVETLVDLDAVHRLIPPDPLGLQVSKQNSREIVSGYVATQVQEALGRDDSLAKEQLTHFTNLTATQMGAVIEVVARSGLPLHQLHR